MGGTRCCGTITDWVSVKKFDANTGEFQWEIINLPHGTYFAPLDLTEVQRAQMGGIYNYGASMENIEFIDGSEYLYLGFSQEVANIAPYIAEWGSLTYPIAFAFDYWGPDNYGFSQNFREVPTYWGGNVEFVEDVQKVVEHGVYKINLKTGDIEETFSTHFSFYTINVNDLGLIFDVPGPWMPSPSTDGIAGISNLGYSHHGSTFPGAAGDFMSCRKTAPADNNTEYICGLNAADPTTRDKKYILGFDVYELNTEIYPNGVLAYARWECFLPDVDGLGEVTVVINSGMSGTEIENAFYAAPHIDTVSVSGDLRDGYLVMDITFISDNVINFQQVRKAATGTSNAQGSTIADLMWVYLPTMQNHVYYIHDYPLPPSGPFESPDRPNGRYHVIRSDMFMFGLSEDVSDPKLFFFTKYTDYEQYIDSFSLDPASYKPTRDWTTSLLAKDSNGNPLLTKFLPPYPGPFGAGFSILPSTYLDWNTNYISIFHETLRGRSALVPRYNGQVISAVDGSTVWEAGSQDGSSMGLQYATNTGYSQLIGETSDIFAVRHLTMVPSHGDGSSSRALQHEYTLSYFQTWSNGTIQRASNHPHGGFMLSDSDSLITFSKGVPIPSGAMKDVPPDYSLILNSPSDDITSSFTGKGWTLVQDMHGLPDENTYPSHQFASIDLVLPTNVYMDDGLRFRFYANYYKEGDGTRLYTSDWFTHTTTYVEIQAWLDSVFGLNEAIGWPGYGEPNARLDPFGDSNSRPASITGDILGIGANAFGSSLISGNITDYYSGGGGFTIWFRGKNNWDLGFMHRPYMFLVNGSSKTDNDFFGIQYEQYTTESALITQSTFSTPNTDSIQWSRNPALASENRVSRQIEKGRSKVLRDDSIVTVFDRSLKFLDSDFPFGLPETLNGSSSIYNA